MEFSQTGLCFLCLRDFLKISSGMIIVHVDDMLFATNNSHQAESHISRFLGKYDIKDVKRADDDGGVSVLWTDRVWTVLRRCETGRKEGRRRRGLSLATRPAGVRESSLRTCKYISSPSRTRGSSVYDRRNSRGAKCDRELSLGDRRNTSRRVFASELKRKQSALLRLRGQPEMGLRVGPLPTKICVLANTDSALHNADANLDEDGSDDERVAKAKQKGIRAVSQHGALVCVVAQDDLEETDAIRISFMTWKSKASKRTILSTFGTEASAGRDALDLAEYTRAMLCEVVIG